MGRGCRGTDQRSMGCIHSCRSVKLGRTSVRPCQHGEQECWRGVIINNTPPIPTLSAIPPTIAPPLTLPLSWCWACPIQRCQNTTNYNLKREYLVGENMKHNQPLCQNCSTNSHCTKDTTLEATLGFSILLQGTSKGGVAWERIKVSPEQPHLS